MMFALLFPTLYYIQITHFHKIPVLRRTMYLTLINVYPHMRTTNKTGEKEHANSWHLANAEMACRQVEKVSLCFSSIFMFPERHGNVIQEDRVGVGALLLLPLLLSFLLLFLPLCSFPHTFPTTPTPTNTGELQTGDLRLIISTLP